VYQNISKDLMQLNFFGILEVISDSAEKECVLPQFLQNNKVDGIILLGQMSQPYLEKLAAADIPFIFLDFSNDHLQVDTIVSDIFMEPMN
jgi:LacI family transcriptional regulator